MIKDKRQKPKSNPAYAETNLKKNGALSTELRKKREEKTKVK